MDTAIISAALGSFTAARDMVKLAFSAKIESEREDAKIEAMTALGKAQDAMYELREELFRLQDENRALKRAAEDAAKPSVMEGYDMVKTTGGATVYESRAEPKHYACPTCLVDYKVSILQPGSNYSGNMRCVACKVNFQVRPDPPINVPNLSMRGGPSGWQR